MPVSLNRWGNTAQDRDFRNKTNENWTKLEETYSILEGNVKTTTDLAKKSVIGIKSKNLFDQSDVTSGYYVVYNTGNLSAAAGFTASSFIPIQANTGYVVSGTSEQCAFYDSNKMYISGLTGTNVPFNSPINAAYIRLSVRTTQLSTVQLEQGAVPTAYESFTPKVDETLLKDNSVKGKHIPSGEIAPEKLSFYALTGLKSRNLFNKSAISTGYFVENNTGNLAFATGYNASEYIPILPSTLYRVSGTTEQGAYYDASKKYISGYTNASNVSLTPANAAYMRQTVKDAQLSITQIEKGTIVTPYVPFGSVYLDVDSIKLPIPEDKLSLERNIMRGVPSRNLFNKSTVSVGYYVSFSSGNLVSMAGFNVSEYIAIQPNTDYVISGTGEQLAFYDANKVYISGLDFATKLKTTPVNAAYIRMSVRDAQLSVTQLEKGTSATPYIPYGMVIGPDQVSFTLPTVEVITKTVKPDGTGDYLSPKLANDSITNSSATKWYEIIIYPGVYTEINWTLKPFVRLIGIDNERCWLKGELPSSATDAEITPQSTINVKDDFEIRNLKITGKNIRYAVHDESSGAVKNTKHNLKNCYVEHYGNKDAEEWRRSQGKLTGPDSVATLWNSTTPYGYGSSSGMTTIHENCTFKSIVRAWYVHNREKFEKANINILRNCKLISTHPDNPISITIENLGSGTNDELVLEGCELNGSILVNDNPWIPYELDYQYANHNDMKIRGYANTPVPYTNNTRGLALKITSNEKVTNSKVVISGSAVPILFGTMYPFEGKGGLQGYVYGRYDVSDITVGLNNDRRVSGMQRRLGNRTSSPVDLVVTFEDKPPITVTFNEDYSSKDNAYILQKINDALGSNGTATLFNPAKLDRPQFTDERATYRNASSVGIPRGSAVRRGNTLTSCELMNSTDDVDDFLGFAENDINPGEAGTIKIKGMQTNDDVLKDGDVNFARGSYIGISSSKSGYIVNTDKTKAIAKGVSSSFFRYKC
ncbi:hypothetical protein COI60_22605 [Bacillus toyonensis]|uniref:hypothetical protein n=2 Tax=Bacillus cereus group TaxID=86661 RepID=UPI000BFC5054|nr:hypothetical protein [Bacillus toyonensis]PHG31270.1 hypothetical protein COI60_22605 [Bacillus toyonensis]